MTCRKAAPLLNDLADFGLDEDLNESIRSHLANCVKCTFQFEEITRLKSLLQGLVVPEPDGDYFLKTTYMVLSRVLSESPVQKRVH